MSIYLQDFIQIFIQKCSRYCSTFPEIWISRKTQKKITYVVHIMMMYWYGLFLEVDIKAHAQKTRIFFQKLKNSATFLNIYTKINKSWLSAKNQLEIQGNQTVHSTKSHWPGDWTIYGWLFFSCLSRVIAGFLESQRVRPVEGRSLCNSVFVDVEDTLQFPFVNLVSGNHSPEIVLNVLQVYLWH